MPERPRARDRYEHHPLAEMFPLLKDAEFHELVEDIRKHGLREPISLFEQKIIDGRNRERACIKAGVEPRYRSIEFDNHDAAAAYVISKNICRRHLTPKQKRALIEKFLRADPTKSDRQIARAVKADNKTVGAVRKRAEARGEIPHVLKRTDSKGRSQVAHKRNSANKRTNSTIDLSDQCIEGVRETIEGTIKDLRRTGATAFEELFAAVAKVIEDLKRRTLPLDDAEGWTLRSRFAERGIEIELGFESRQLSKEYPSMTSVRKKTSSEIFRTPRWLRGPPRSANGRDRDGRRSRYHCAIAAPRASSVVVRGALLRGSHIPGLLSSPPAFERCCANERSIFNTTRVFQVVLRPLRCGIVPGCRVIAAVL